MGKDFKHLSEMEEIFDKVLQTQSAFEKAIEEYRELHLRLGSWKSIIPANNGKKILPLMREVRFLLM